MSYNQDRSDRGDRPRGGSSGEDRAPRGDADAQGAGRRPFFRRRKTCPFSGPSAPKIDWKDEGLLKRFLSERGKIVPARITAVSTKKQRELALAIKQARYMAILPYVAKDTK